MVVHRVVSAVGYVQRVLRFRSDLMGIENVEVPVDRPGSVGRYVGTPRSGG